MDTEEPTLALVEKVIGRTGLQLFLERLILLGSRGGITQV